MAAICGLLSVSGMTFLALNSLMFGIYTGMICIFTLDKIIEIAAILYYLYVGAIYIKPITPSVFPM